MVLFVLKSSACLAIFLMFYKLLLEKEQMHSFKRYYLLFALVFAFVIPSLTFVEYVEVTPAPISYENAVAVPVGQQQAETLIPMDASMARDVFSAFDSSVFLWTIYLIGVLFFSLRFLRNLLAIARNVKNNPKLRIDTLINVLLQQCKVPHTFFNYIFLDRKKFETGAIPKEVLIHEATHAKQKHSLDVLFVELLQIAFWFNPLLYIAKRSIKLNHEFLADQAVLKNGTPTSDYQNTLLGFASSAAYTNYQPSMVNAINYSSYSSIKKRFTVMKTRTSKKAVLLRSSLILPLFVVLLMGFSESRTIEILKEDPIVNERAYTAEIIKIFIDSTGQIYLDNDRVALKNLPTLLRQFNAKLSKKERENEVRAKIFPYDNTPESVILEIEQILQGYGIAQIDVIGPEIVSFSAIQNGATKEELTKYNTLAKIYNAQPKQNRVIPVNDLKTLETLYRKMSKKQKADAQPFPECPDPKSDQQKGATGKQVAEYNALAKKYNKMLAENDHIRIKKSDIERLEYLHGLMTHQQRENAEPFPDFPEPPEPPAPPSPPDKSEKEIADELIEEIIAHQDSYDNVNVRVTPNRNPSINPTIAHNIYVAVDRNAEEEIMEHMEVQERIEEDVEINETVAVPPVPPAPPKPKSPLDYVIEMAKKDARFYYEGKEISADKAIELMEKNKNLNIDSRRENGERPIVKLSTEPFKSGN